MPRLIPIRLAAACALALLLFVSTTAIASAKKVEVDLRVVAKHKDRRGDAENRHDQHPDQP